MDPKTIEKIVKVLKDKQLVTGNLKVVSVNEHASLKIGETSVSINKSILGYVVHGKGLLSEHGPLCFDEKLNQIKHERFKESIGAFRHVRERAKQRYGLSVTIDDWIKLTNITKNRIKTRPFVNTDGRVFLVTKFKNHEMVVGYSSGLVKTVMFKKKSIKYSFIHHLKFILFGGISLNNQELKEKYPLLAIGMRSACAGQDGVVEKPKGVLLSASRVYTKYGKNAIVHLSADYYEDCPYPLQILDKTKTHLRLYDIHRDETFTVKLKAYLFVRDVLNVGIDKVPRGWQVLSADNLPEDSKDILYLPKNFRETSEKAFACYRSSVDEMLYDMGGCGYNINSGYFKYVEDFTPK